LPRARHCEYARAPMNDDARAPTIHDQVVDCSAYEDGRKVATVAIEDISEVLKVPGQFVWIGLHEPSAPLLRKVQEEFELHDLAVEDALRAHQRPKLEEYGEDLFIVVRTAQSVDGAIGFGETHMFIGPNYVVTVRHGPSLPYADVRARCEHTPELLKMGPSFVLYALIDFIVDNYFPILEDLEEQVEDLEQAVLVQQLDRNRTLRIHELKRSLLQLKRAVTPLIDVTARLERFDLALIDKNVRPYFRDVHDHAVRLNERIDTMREVLSSVLEVNLSLTGVNQNEVMKKLAAWAAILAAPTLLAGVWGMNFEAMPELRVVWGYPLAIGVMLSVCAGLYVYFKRSGWL
jgi:magnesium transporter